jgi:hypothetical protein
MIKGKLLKYCASCNVKNRFTGKVCQGHWQPTHYTDEHKGPVTDANANLAESEPKKVSFKGALLSAQNGGE